MEVSTSRSLSQCKDYGSFNQSPALYLYNSCIDYVRLWLKHGAFIKQTQFLQQRMFVLNVPPLTFWRRIFFFNFSTPVYKS